MFRALLRTRFAALRASMFRSQRGGKNFAARRILITLLFVYVFAALLFSVGTTCSALAPAMIAAGMGKLYFALIGAVAFLVSFVSSVFTATKQLYEANDNDLLLSMPIPPSCILGSRIVMLLALEYIFTAIVMLPAAAVYFWYAGPDAAAIVCLVLAFLLLPLLTLALVCLIGWLLSLITSRMRNKNLLTYAFMIVFFVAYFYFFKLMQGDFTKLVTNGTGILDAIGKIAPPFAAFGAAALGNFGQLGLFALWCCVPFALVYWLLSAKFIGIVTVNRGAAKIKYVRRELRASGQRSALLRRELGRFFGMPMYVINCGIGVVLELIFAVVLLFKGSSLLGDMQQDMGAATAAIPVLALSFCSLMTMPAACSVSLEGKRLWILKSAPVPTRDILNAKINTNLIIGLPGALIASVLCCVALKLGAAECAVTILLPAAIQIFAAVFGLTANLLLPRFDWTNETMVIKQSGSVLLAMFGGMGLLMLGGLLYILAFSALNLTLYIGICAAAVFAADAALAVFVNTRGVKMFERM